MSTTSLESTPPARSLMQVSRHDAVGCAASRDVDLARVVLVCGVGRSGTSLLHSMLNAHPELAFPPETHFFRRFIVPRRTRARLEGGSVDALARLLAADLGFARAGVSPEEALDGERTGAISLTRVFGRVLSACATRQGKRRVGDKDPRNIDALATLAATFPRGYLLHVIRDPRAVLLSRTRAAWSRSRRWWQHVLLAEEQLRHGRQLGARLFSARYLEVRYEDLVAAPEETLRTITRHIGLEFSSAMLDFRASAASLVDSRERAWKEETLGPLLVDNDDKWRVGLTPLQVRFVERASREAFERLGYRPSVAFDDAQLGARVLGAVAPALRNLSRPVFAARRALEGQR